MSRSFPNREEREKCWNARDDYWECLDKHGMDTKSSEVCQELRKTFENSCSHAWVKYFDRRKDYLRHKDALERGVYDGSPESFQNKK